VSIFPKKTKIGYPPHVLLDSAKAHSGFAEAYRTLRTSMHFLLLENHVRSVVVTSAGESEGKTVTAMNLAHAFSQAGKSVLVIDADLRKNALTGLHRAKGPRGLTRLLSDLLTADVRSGALAEYSIADLVVLHRLQRADGLLHVTDGTEEVEVRFMKGRIGFIRWKTRPEDSRLDQVLVRNGLLSVENMDIALRQRRDTGKPLGYVLNSLGMVPSEKLRGVLTLHTLEAIRTLLRMEAGSFYFTDLPGRRSEDPSSDLVDLERLFDEASGGERPHRFLSKQVEDALVRRADMTYALIPSGPLPPNPSELIGSRQMRFLLDYLTERFDLVIFDSAPVLAASDSVLLSGQTDGVALVVKAGHLKRGLVRKAVEQLQVAHAHVLGVVLNRVDVKKGAYYEYYQRYYSTYHAQPARK
jgi:Mrp family chromosome partitioning ATPase